MKEEVRDGRIAERLLEHANALDADLLVAGRQGMNSLARRMIGSVTTSVLRGARCSVLIVPEPAFAELDRLRRQFTGMSESREPEEWAIQLDAFTRRNAGRRATVEVDDLATGAQVLETGYTLRGTTYDSRDRRVKLMLGDAHWRSCHVARSIGNVESICVATDTHGRDMALRIRHGPGQTLRTFAPS